MNNPIMQRLEAAFKLQMAGDLDQAQALCLDVRRQVPKEPAVHYILGVIYHKKRSLAEAEKAFQKAARLNPRDPGALAGLGMVAYDRGRMQEASTTLRKALSLAPNDPGLMGNLALALRGQSKYQEAVEFWQKALRIAPQDLSALLNLAVTLDQMDRTDAAEPLFARALTLAPTDPDVVIGASNHAIRMGDFDRARGLVAGCIERHKSHPALLESLAMLEMMLGDAQQATDYAWQAIAASSDRMGAFLQILDSAEDRKAVIADARAQPVLDVARARSRERSGTAVSLLEAGRILDRIGEYPAAAKAFKAGNEKTAAQLRAFGQAYDPAIVDRYIAALEEALPRLVEAVSRQNHTNPDRPAPIFVVGMPRSGTTLIEHVLGAHPEVAACGEMEGLQVIAQTLGGGHFAAPDPAWIERVCAPDFDPIAHVPGYYAVAEREAMAEDWAAAHWMVDKNLFNFLHIALAAALFPDARFVYCQRADADVALSIYSMHFVRSMRFDCDLAAIAHYQRSSRKIMEIYQSAFGDRIVSLVYEEFVADAEPAARQLLASLGVPWDDRCLSHSGLKRKAATASKAQVRRAVNSSSVGRNAHYNGLLPLPE